MKSLLFHQELKQKRLKASRPSAFSAACCSLFDIFFLSQRIKSKDYHKRLKKAKIHSEEKLADSLDPNSVRP